EFTFLMRSANSSPVIPNHPPMGSYRRTSSTVSSARRDLARVLPTSALTLARLCLFIHLSFFSFFFGTKDPITVRYRRKVLPPPDFILGHPSRTLRPSKSSPEVIRFGLRITGHERIHVVLNEVDHGAWPELPVHLLLHTGAPPLERIPNEAEAHVLNPGPPGRRL